MINQMSCTLYKYLRLRFHTSKQPAKLLNTPAWQASQTIVPTDDLSSVQVRVKFRLFEVILNSGDLRNIHPKFQHILHGYIGYFLFIFKNQSQIFFCKYFDLIIFITALLFKFYPPSIYLVSMHLGEDGLLAACSFSYMANWELRMHNK